MGFEWLPKKNYKQHYICLECKKGFKKPSFKDIKNVKSSDFSNLMKDYYALKNRNDILIWVKEAYNNLKVICPNCKNNMIKVHYDFEVPSMKDNKSWKRLQKTLASKLIIKYDVFIQWHINTLTEIKDKNLPLYKEYKINLDKLKQLNNLTQIE